MEDNNAILTAKIAELEQVKEDLKQAKEDATQSWLDSRPLIDEFEKMQGELESTKARVHQTNTTITQLQSQLGTTDMCIKSAKNEEQSLRMTINDRNQNVHKMQEEIERLKTRIDQKRRRRSKLKLVLRLKRQTLESLELTSEAIKRESEAFTTSAAHAYYYINNSELASFMIQLSQDEYEYLKREANEQIAVAERRFAVSAEEKLAAEKGRDSAFRRLQSLKPQNRFRQTIHEETVMKNRHAYNRAGSSGKHREVSNGGVKSITGVGSNNPRLESQNDNTFRVKKKESICFRIKTFIVRSLRNYFK